MPIIRQCPLPVETKNLDTDSGVEVFVKKDDAISSSVGPVGVEWPGNNRTF